MNIIGQAERKWFAFYVKPKQEFKSEEQLLSINIEAYLPVVEVRKRWSDRWKTITEPLFRGYIFVNVTEKERLTGLQQKAIVNTVSFSGKPAEIPADQINNLKKLLETKKEIFVKNKIETGDKVTVAGGPFEGIEGVVFETDGNDRMLAVTIDLLNRSVIVRLPYDNVITKKS